MCANLSVSRISVDAKYTQRTDILYNTNNIIHTYITFHIYSPNILIIRCRNRSVLFLISRGRVRSFKRSTADFYLLWDFPMKNRGGDCSRSPFLFALGKNVYLQSGRGVWNGRKKASRNYVSCFFFFLLLFSPVVCLSGCCDHVQLENITFPRISNESFCLNVYLSQKKRCYVNNVIKQFRHIIIGTYVLVWGYLLDCFRWVPSIWKTMINTKITIFELEKCYSMPECGFETFIFNLHNCTIRNVSIHIDMLSVISKIFLEFVCFGIIIFDFMFVNT